MLPHDELSTQPVPSPFLTPLRLVMDVDYEWGGEYIQNPSKGLFYTLWSSSVDGCAVHLHSAKQSKEVLRANYPILNHSFTFDQNMNPAVVFTTEEGSSLMFYDTELGKQTTLYLGSGYEYSQLALDDARAHQSGISDIILAYVKENKLYYRLQRERFVGTHLLGDVTNYRLTQIGMTKNYRFRFRLVKKIKGE